MPSGDEIKAALKKASVWGTPVACGAGDGILLTGDSLKRRIENIPVKDLGVAFVRDREQGKVTVAEVLNANLRYEGLDLALALCMGATGGAPAQQGATAAYAQTFTIADIIDGLFGTLAVNKVVNVFEYPSVKVEGFTIKGEMGGPVSVDFDVAADDEVEDSATNSLASFANVTYRDMSNVVLMSQGVFRINDQAAAALGPGDVINVSAFELAFRRKNDRVFVTGGGNRISEPLREEEPEITLKLTFPRYTSTAYIGDLGADTRKKMDITFTGRAIEGAYNYQFRFQLPHLAILNADAATEKEQIKHPLELAAMAAASAPAGMTGITKPFQLDIVNKQSADVLA